ncbi:MULTISPECIES: hypothetical protein [Bacillaceae]|uniref:hypothetical protein n=1 Tax=Bacillaceae TaxID=186817 RepID=UPI002964B621|nr:hypothetical protein [Bacillus infantis]MDW2879559.1 hypothetical protein [Bacillus infantis]
MTFRLSNLMPNQSRVVEEKKEVKKKFFFVIEGEKTENIYIRELAQSVRKDSLIDVLILERIRGSHSNQYKITATIENYIKANEQLTEENKNKLLDLSDKFEEEEINEVDLYSELEEILGDAKEHLIIEHNNQIIEQIRTLNELSTYQKDLDNMFNIGQGL